MSDTLCLTSVEELIGTCVAKHLYQIDPLRDCRWAGFLERHPRASVFHTKAWLESLRRTYGYKPIAYTTSAPNQDLDNAVVFCSVDSWLTGRRLVSLPFSDHCEPLLDGAEDLRLFGEFLQHEIGQNVVRYIEMRPLESLNIATGLHQSTLTYTFHRLDLASDLGTLFRNFHKGSTQRKIRRAAREHLEYKEGSSESLLDEFYRLFCLTRRRHSIPPQPKRWFRNLMNCLGEALKIRVAGKHGRIVAAMITISHKDTLVYKYGCSDPRFNNLGGMHLLFWKSIQEAKNSGLRFLDLGRTDAGQTGLSTFKSRWGASSSALTYRRYAALGTAAHIFDPPVTDWKSRIAKQVFAHSHPRVLSVMGSLLYKHVG